MYEEFEKWLDKVLDKYLPFEAVGINFNPYEEADLKKYIAVGIGFVDGDVAVVYQKD